jgi:hypothetical protein
MQAGSLSDSQETVMRAGGLRAPIKKDYGNNPVSTSCSTIPSESNKDRKNDKGIGSSRVE